jgi:putative tryptophan/tyrosine transport system substrate-binding protein
MICRAIGLLVTLALLWAPCAAMAQPPAPIPRVGVLAPVPPGTIGIDAFRQGLRDLGYVEGQNILVESRYADWQLDRLPAPNRVIILFPSVGNEADRVEPA